MRPSTDRDHKVTWREIKPFCRSCGSGFREVGTRHVQTIDAAKNDRFNINSSRDIKCFSLGPSHLPISGATGRALIMPRKRLRPGSAVTWNARTFL